MSIKQRLFPILNKAPVAHALPEIEQGSVIPKIIHQTFPTKTLSTELQGNVDQLKAANPDWEYRLYDDADIVQFISEFYGPTILGYYNRINPRYGAAKADLFRYLLLYKYGGVYLDIKSTFTKPIADVLQPNDRYLLSGWANRPGEECEMWGKPRELSMIPDGEFQQWHIVCVPGHPFLKAVIQSVLTNIDIYKPWLHGTGSNGVFRLTGPTAYTLAIYPMLPFCSHRKVRTNDELNLTYSMLGKSHTSLFKSHYVVLTESILTMKGWEKGLSHLYSGAKKIQHRLEK